LKSAKFYPEIFDKYADQSSGAAAFVTNWQLFLCLKKTLFARMNGRHLEIRPPSWI